MEESSPIVAAIVVIILPAVIFGAVLKSYKGAFIVGFLLLLLLFLQIPTGLYVFFLLIILPFVAVLLRTDKKRAAMPLAERQRYLDEQRGSALTLGHGSLNYYILYYILLLLLVWLVYSLMRSAKTREDFGSARPTAAGYVYEEYNLEEYVREMSCTPLSKADCDAQKREIRECGQFGENHCQIVDQRELLHCVNSHRDRSITIFDCMKFSSRKAEECRQEWRSRCGSR